MTSAVAIEPMMPADWPEVRSIYLEGIATGNATFQQTAPEWSEWDENHLRECRFVARAGQTIVGWVALGRVSTRQVYAGVAEVSVYVAGAARGGGIGSKLLAEVILASEAAGVWTLQAGIFPENGASIHLHQKAGFRVVGVRERMGNLAGRWRDVVLLERRSLVAGT